MRRARRPRRADRGAHRMTPAHPSRHAQPSLAAGVRSRGRGLLPREIERQPQRWRLMLALSVLLLIVGVLGPRSGASLQGRNGGRVVSAEPADIPAGSPTSAAQRHWGGRVRRSRAQIRALGRQYRFAVSPIPVRVTTIRAGSLPSTPIRRSASTRSTPRWQRPTGWAGSGALRRWPHAPSCRPSTTPD